MNNSDRNLSQHGGNVNILFDYLNNRHFLIDHNLAFADDGKDSDFDYHVYSSRHREWVFDFVDRQQSEDRITAAKAVVRAAMDNIPEEWKLEPIENITYFTFIKNTLDRALNPEFWSRIT